ncbi:MAG: DMT family transporter [Ruminiclostridium sp.]|nr:DMT family transporter [Ruminiclostridium sp.]
MTQKTQLRGVLMLLLTAFIWGTSFVAQSVGMESVEAFTFNGIRTLMGACVLLPFIMIRDRLTAKKMTDGQLAERKRLNKKTVVYGAVLGIVLCAASNFQQFAFNYSTSGKIAFITAFYMLFVPLIGLIFRKKTPLITWICVAFGFVGLYFLCMNPDDMSAVNKGDILSLICSVIYAVHILLVEKFAPDVDGIKLSCVQFAVSGTISCILMFIFENPQISAIGNAILPILYSGIMSCGLAYTFQIVGQKYTEATVASLLMCMESVFGVLSGAVVLHEILSGREIIGCVIMFAAIILSQLSDLITTRIAKRPPQ